MEVRIHTSSKNCCAGGFVRKLGHFGNPVMWGGWTWAQIFQSWSEAIAHVQTAWFCSTSGAWEEPDLKMGAWKDLISCPSQELLLHMVMSSTLSWPPAAILRNDSAFSSWNYLSKFPCASFFLLVFNFEKQLSALFPYHDFYVSLIYFGYRIKLTSSSYCRLGPLQLSSTKFVYKQEGAGGECLISSSIKLTIA